MANKKHAIHDLADRVDDVEGLWELQRVFNDERLHHHKETVDQLSTLRLRIARMEDQRRNASWVLIVLVISVVALIVRSGL